MHERVTVLSGGVGGAKLVLGLHRILGAQRLQVIANTGDDFVHLGLMISPDLDTLMYTLAGEVNEDTGWGLADETWNFMDALRRLKGETWFQLGDRDLATHVERTRQLATGRGLTEITADFCARLSVNTEILPMTDDPVRTRVGTVSGDLEFQHYFVRDRAEPIIRSLDYHGADRARASEKALQALAKPDLSAILIAPSNPYLSIDPILALPAIRNAVATAKAAVVAVSPIVGNRALKGPTAKIMAELGLEVSALSVARHYGDLLDGFILDKTDRGMAQQVENLGLKVTICDTIMNSIDDKLRLASEAMDFARTIAPSH